MINSNNVFFAYTDGRVIHDVGWFFRAVKYAKQRVVRGYADCDIWDFNVFLGRIVAGGLNALEDEEHGFPERYGSAENWENELKRIAGLARKFADEYLDSGDTVDDEYKEIKNEVFDWVKENFEDLWD